MADKINQIFENFEAIGEGFTVSGAPPHITNLDHANATHSSRTVTAGTYWTPAAGVYQMINLSGHWSIYVSGVCDGTNQRYYSRNSVVTYYLIMP